MIHAALSHLSERLNEFLSRGTGVAENIALVSQLFEQDGSPTPGAANKLVLFLANIEKEFAAGSTAPAHSGSAWKVRRPPPVHLNLYVMLAANSGGTNYPEALKMISAAIMFFQKNPVFDHQTSPGLDPRIEKLLLDIENLGRQDLANIWGVLGGKYLPSVLYKVRMVTFDGQDIQALEPTINRPETKVRP